jgi:two-component system sensor histidine kinase KdpD
VACFDFLFVPPRFTFAVTDFQYLITFGVMLAVGLITGHLTAGLRFQARVASHREKRARALYEFRARAVRRAAGRADVRHHAHASSSAPSARATLLVPDDDAAWPPASAGRRLAACRCWISASRNGPSTTPSAGLGTGTLPASPVFYLPLVAPMRTRGVLAIEPEQRRWLLMPEQRQQLDTFAALAAIALERVHYIEVAQNALVRWSPSGCAIRCWRRCRTTCARR